MKTIRNIAPALLMVVVLVALAFGIGLVSRDGQGQQPSLSGNSPNADLSNDELVSTALGNMATLEQYGLDLVAVEPSGAITPTSYFSLTGYEQPGKGIALSARGKSGPANTYSIVAIMASTASQLPYEMVVSGESMYVSGDRGNTWQLLAGQAAGYFIPPVVILCTWGAGTGVDWSIPRCADMVSSSQFHDGEPTIELIDGLPTRHLTADLMATIMNSSGSLRVPMIINDSPEALSLHVWISTDATPRVVRMRVDMTSSEASGEGVIAPFIAVAFSPDGKLLAGAHMAPVGSAPGQPLEDGTLLLWDLTRAESPPVKLGGRYSDDIRGVAFSPDGNVLAATGYRGVHIWETANLGADPEVLTIPGNVSLPSMAFSADSQILGFAGSEDGIYIWEQPYKGAPTLAIPDQAGALAFSPDNRTLATSGKGGVRLYALDDLKATPTLLNVQESVPAGEVHYRTDSLTFSPDGQMLAVNSDPDGGDSTPGQMVVWDVRSSQRPLATFPGGGGMVMFSPDGKFLAVEGGQVWDVTELLSAGSSASALMIEGICGNAPGFSPDSRKLAVACYDGYVQVWDVSNVPDAGEPTIFMRDPADANKLTYSLTWSWSRFDDDFEEIKPPAPETIKQP